MAEGEPVAGAAAVDSCSARAVAGSARIFDRDRHRAIGDDVRGDNGIRHQAGYKLNYWDKESAVMKENKHQRMNELLAKAQLCSDEEEQAGLLMERGKLCISKAYIKLAKAAAKDTKNDREFLINLGKVYPMLKLEEDKIYVVYPKCYCPTRKIFKGEVPHFYCHCSVGWVKEMFEQALGRKIEVKLESSVLRGDNDCRLRVLL